MQTAASGAVTTAKKNWALNDLPWDQFDPALVDPEILKIIKAAALVEYNAHDYAAYLCNVFKDDPEFQDAAKTWALEEVQHGEALAMWAEKADPSFNFKERFKIFTDGYKINLDANQSVRGSLSGELIARCIVETGTSSYYTALGDAVKEPVLKAICKNIAGDELRHYKLFYTYLDKYLERDGLKALDRIKVGLARIGESEDDELAYAYYAANHAHGTYQKVANDNQGVDYNRKRFSDEYAARAYGCYRHMHLERVVTMVFKACGLNTQGALARFVGQLAWMGISSRVRGARKRIAKAA